MEHKGQSKIHKIGVSKDKNPYNETLKNWKHNIKKITVHEDCYINQYKWA